MIGFVCEFVCFGWLYFWVIIDFYVLVCSRLFLCFSILVCQFLCLVICVLFRVCLVFVLASFVICLFVGYFLVSVHWGFPVLVCFGFRIVLGSVCVMPCLLFKDLFQPCPKILLEKPSINPERVCKLVDAREFHVG